MMKYYLIFVIVILSFDSTAQGSYSDKCPLNPQQLTMIDTVALGDTLHYEISYGLGDGCTNFQGLEVKNNGNDISHRLYANCPPPDVVCTDIYRTGHVTNFFIPNKKGKFYFKFFMGERMVKVKELTVL